MMRTAWVLVTGFAFVGWLSCGDSSSSNLFANTGAGGGLSTSATGTTSSSGSAGTDGSTTASTGAAGSGVGTTATTATGAGGSGSGGAAGSGEGTAGAATGGSAGATGSGSGGRGGGAGSGGADAGTGGISGVGGSAGAGGAAGAKSDGGIGGAGGGPVDAGPPDTGSQAVIRCGNTSCPVATQFCCIPTNEIARCVALTSVNLCPDTADRIRCDDRTDCPSENQVCCAEAGFGVMGASVTCRTQAACDSLNQTEELCEPNVAGQCQGGGTNACRVDNQSVIAGYAFCH